MEEKKDFDYLFTRMIARKQMFNIVPTFCKKCGQKITLKFIDDFGSFTRKCGCGCEIFEHHSQDDFHVSEYFIKKFVSANSYKKNYKNLNFLEKNGFNKTKNGNYSRG